ncbi:MAG: 4-hydroxythreonine-4-phosphate dehydrogenase PdxA [Prevotellaceae bacterium]|jgi:4-hydroxythreonine-4-phosphate dehydrogenase|nr:4-hydroxythreonine-4-phosphate dehydrogenase PdxA [Prevotellaceae bacterium]
MKPRLAITMGDPAGIGPEIVVKALAQERVYEQCRPLVVGDEGVLRRACRAAGVQPKQLEVYDIGLPGLEQVRYGEVSALAGEAAFRSVRTAIELAMRGEVDGTVTAPLNKEAIHLAGHPFDGHTEIYAHYTGSEKYAMLLADEFLRVIHVSTHVSLRQACDRVKRERIIDVTRLMVDACRQFGIEEPRIGIAGLNPHAGENGLFGHEEQQEIIPAVSELQAMGYRVTGPVPPDTLFAKARCGQFDGCVAMYHDQGHIPFKVVGFQWDSLTGRMKSVQGVNITLGLPIIRVSVDHGTAFDIAGQGIASADALLLSIDYAARMAARRG